MRQRPARKVTARMTRLHAVAWPPRTKEIPMSHRGGAHLGCTDFRQHLTPDRRSFLKAGILGTAGLSLAQLLRAEARASGSPAPSGARPSAIILWMRGGPSHIDMWDPKPAAPAEYRGEFGVKPTSVPGILLS